MFRPRNRQTLKDECWAGESIWRPKGICVMLSVENSRSHEGEQLDPAVCWKLLERVAASPHLRRASRLCELLLYVGQRSLREGCEHVPEQEIGVKVFGRPDTYDNGNDSIVRTTISDLRKRIDAYFVGEGVHEPIVMEIPRGAYVPVFFSRDSRPAVHEEFVGAVASDLRLANEHARPEISSTDRVVRWVAGAVILVLAVVSINLWRENREARHSIHPWKYDPSLAPVWSNFLDGGRDTDVVMEDSSVLLVQLISKQGIAMSDYINKTYLGTSSIQGINPETYRDLFLISRKALGKASDFRLGLGIHSLDPQNQRLHFYNAREYTPRLLENDNVILLGNPLSNPWYQWFENSLNFTEIPATEGATPVFNRSPKVGESATYTSQENPGRGKTIAHCVVAYLPKPDHSGYMLLIQGTTSEATEAGGQFVLSEDRMADFTRQVHATKLPYFEVLLHVSQVLGTAVTAKVEAYRLYPNLR